MKKNRLLQAQAWLLLAFVAAGILFFAIKFGTGLGEQIKKKEYLDSLELVNLRLLNEELKLKIQLQKKDSTIHK